MTNEEYIAVTAREGHPFTFTRIRSGVANVEFLPGEGTYIKYANRAADTLEIVGLPVGFLQSGDVITVAYKAASDQSPATVFRGEVDSIIKDHSRGDEAAQSATVKGPWAKMARLTYRQEWKTGASATSQSSRLILNEALDGTNQQLNTALLEIARGNNPATTPAALGYQVGTISVSTVQLPFDECRDITLADALSRELRYFPEAVTKFDYSTTPPTLNIAKPVTSGTGYADAAYVATIPKTQRQYVYNAHPVNAVDLEIDTTGDVDGVTYHQITHQQARKNSGVSYVNNPDCLYATLQVAGFSGSAVQQTFDSVTEPIFMLGVNGVTDPAFWKAKHPYLANVPLTEGSIIIHSASRSGQNDHPEDYPNISKNTIGDILAAGLKARVEKFTADVKITRTGGPNSGVEEIEDHVILTMDFVTTNATTRTYTWTASSSGTSGETVPSDLAQALLDARSKELQEESFTMRLGSAASWPTLGDTCDGLVLQDFTVDCTSLTASLHFGTPDYLSPEDMAGLLTGFRNKRRATFATMRKTGETKDAGDTVDMGGVMPLSSTEFSPGIKSKTTLRSDTTATTTPATRDGSTASTPAYGEIVLDCTTVDSGDTMTTHDMIIRKPVAANTTGNTVPVLSSRKYLATTDADFTIPALLQDASGNWYINDGAHSVEIGGSGGGGGGGGGDDSSVSGSGGIFSWTAATQTMGKGGCMVGRRFIEATMNSSPGPWSSLANATYSLKITLGSSPTVEVVSGESVGQSPSGNVSYIPIYTISGGKISADYRGAFVAPAYVSIHARRVTGDGVHACFHERRDVSIHARRVTGDVAHVDPLREHVVSIHARRVTGDRHGRW